mgnify:CR=1 FL=1
MKLHYAKRLVLPAILIAGFAGFFIGGGDQLISWQSLSQHYNDIKDFSHQRRFASYLLFFLIYIAAVAFSLPIASVLTLAGGAVFGWPAAALIITAASIGAGVVFLAARSVFADLFRRRAGVFLARLEDGFSSNAFQYLLALRLLPVAPFWAVNIVPALTSMRLAPFFAATFIGIIPGTMVYVAVGRGFDHILAVGKTPDLSILASPQILLPLGGLGILALLPSIYRYWKSYRTGPE